MKLLEQFKQQLTELQNVQRVWFTTFSLRIDFVEKYLLPAILEMDSPRNRLDYEGIQQGLVKQRVDIHLFTDQRMLTQASDRKRTSIPVTGVAPQQLKGFSAASLFHPKVIYLESKDGRGILGAGSANLTVDGWGRNQEVFAFCKVATDEQAAQIRSFFRPLFFNTFRPDGFPKIASKLWGADRKWKFVHSLDGERFPHELGGGARGLDEIAIASPYFPQDLAGYASVLRQRLQSPELVLHIVPDLLSGLKVRTGWTPELQLEIEQKRIRFYRTNMPSKADAMQHAKVWATRSAVAIGSWNCTHPGSNAGRLGDEWDSDNNIEAGIIFPKRDWHTELLGRAVAVTKANFLTDMELRQEALDIPPASPVGVRVRFDWRSQDYCVSIEWVGTPVSGYRLFLPDHGNIPIDRTMSRFEIEPIFIPEPNEIVSNHFFQIDYRGDTVLQGVIEESQLEHRRGECYQNLDDLLDSHIPEYEGRPGGPRSPRGVGDEEGGAEEPATVVETKQIASYFKVFYALHAYADKLLACATVLDLERQVFVMPGGLKELQEKIRQLRDEKPDAIYTWFLIQELNLLIKVAKKRMHELPDGREDRKWKTLQPETTPKTRFGTNVAFIELIRKECQYV